MHILKLITHTAEDRGLSREFIVEAIKETLTAVVQNDFGESANVEVEVSDSTGRVSAFLLKKVVNRVTNPLLEISIKEAQLLEQSRQVGTCLQSPKEGDTTCLYCQDGIPQKTGQSLKVGDEIRTEFPFSKLSRNAIAMAKNMLLQRIKDKEKEMVQQKYMTKIGEIETGTVQKVDKYELIIKLKDAEGVMPLREQIPGEKYYQGNTIKAYVLNVTPGGRVLLSRSHPNFLKKLFEKEVPEIHEKVVEIKLAARIPGIRAKIAVSSNNPKVDPVGACVGVKGARIQAVMKELNNEKIDVIQWTSEPIALISKALSGVTILHQDLNLKEGKVSLVVKDEELPKAIGKNGQNTTLASKLTGLKIDILSESEYKSKGIALLQGISKSIKETLILHGFFTTTDILNKGVDELIKLPGISEKDAEKIFNIVQKLMQ